MKIIKIGGGCLKGKQTIGRVIELLSERGLGHILVLSALNGVTDSLAEGMSEALADEQSIGSLIRNLRNKHMAVARHLISNRQDLKAFSRDLHESMNELERFYYGLHFTKEMTPRMRDTIASFGERFAVKLLAFALQSRGIRAHYRMPEEIGLTTDGRFGDATANMKKTRQNLGRLLGPFMRKDEILLIPGFFGVSENGDLTTFGRGGSDYSAAVIAVALQAETLEVWKDVAGFMSADPKLVPEAQLIPVLSFEEAAELAYFGAKILHPRTVEPIRGTKLNISIRSTMDPDAPGSLIAARSPRPKNVIKSVAHDTDIGILKIHGSGVGARPGILAHVASQLTDSGINIKSVVTSQTCISFLLAKSDLDNGYNALRSVRPKLYRRIEKLEEVALISIVGEGLVRQRGIAARCFSAVAGDNINVEMISFGPSRVALYFLTRSRDLLAAVRAIHTEFFSQPV